MGVGGRDEIYHICLWCGSLVGILDLYCLGGRMNELDKCCKCGCDLRRDEMTMCEYCQKEVNKLIAKAKENEDE